MRARLVVVAVAVLVAALVGTSIAHADSLTLPAMRDNTLFEDEQGSTSSGSGPSVFAGVNNLSNARRALVFFDVGAIPAGAVVDSVELEMHVSSASDPEVRVMSLHRVLADWGEGISSASGGNGAPSTPNDATWIHRFFPGVPWATPGGDFTNQMSAVAEVGGVGTYTWSASGMTTDVISWLETPASSFGWLIMADESVDGTARRFDSRESPVEEDRPVLTVYFTIPDPVEATSWGHIKSHWGEGIRANGLDP